MRAVSCCASCAGCASVAEVRKRGVERVSCVRGLLMMYCCVFFSKAVLCCAVLFHVQGVPLLLRCASVVTSSGRSLSSTSATCSWVSGDSQDCLSPYLYVLAIDPTFKPHPRHALNKAMTALFWSIIISILSLKLPVHFRVHLGPFCAGV